MESFSWACALNCRYEIASLYRIVSFLCRQSSIWSIDRCTYIYIHPSFFPQSVDNKQTCSSRSIFRTKNWIYTIYINKRLLFSSFYDEIQKPLEFIHTRLYSVVQRYPKFREKNSRGIISKPDDMHRNSFSLNRKNQFTYRGHRFRHVVYTHVYTSNYCLEPELAEKLIIFIQPSEDASRGNVIFYRIYKTWETDRDICVYDVYWKTKTMAHFRKKKPYFKQSSLQSQSVK